MTVKVKVAEEQLHERAIEEFFQVKAILKNRRTYDMLIHSASQLVDQRLVHLVVYEIELLMKQDK